MTFIQPAFGPLVLLRWTVLAAAVAATGGAALDDTAGRAAESATVSGSAVGAADGEDRSAATAVHSATSIGDGTEATVFAAGCMGATAAAAAAGSTCGTTSVAGAACGTREANTHAWHTRCGRALMPRPPVSAKTSLVRVQASQSTRPHARQWCLLRKNVNTMWHAPHASTSASCCHCLARIIGPAC